jgi:drug/metabolite transporter (DMT)-like permease
VRARLQLLSLPLLVTVVTWGFNFVSVKILYREVAPNAVLMSRFLVMWALLVLWCLARKESLRPKSEDRLRILLVGFITMGVYMALFLTGMHGTTAGEGAIILATVPLITPVIAVAMKQEEFSPPAFVGAAIAFSGVVCVALGGSAGSHGSLVGNATIFVSAFVWAFGIVLSRPLLKVYSPLQLQAMSMPGALPVLLPLGFLEMVRTPWSHLSPTGWAMFAQLAALSGVVGFVFFNMGIKQVGASGASLYQFFVPLVAALFAFFLLHQSLSPVQWLGFAVVMAGVGYASVARQRASLKAATVTS